MVLRSTQHRIEMSTRKISWGKGDRCVGLTTLPPSCADCHEIWKLQPPGTLMACPGLYRDCFPFKGWNSSVGMETRYGFGPTGELTPVEARFSAPFQIGPGAYPACYTMGTGSFPGKKRPRRGVDHPPTPSVEVKERAELYLYSPSGPSWPRLGRTLAFLLDGS
jgi:hypothetical protein